MKEPILIKNATIINEGKNFVADVLIENDIISDIGNLSVPFIKFFFFHNLFVLWLLFFLVINLNE